MRPGTVLRISRASVSIRESLSRDVPNLSNGLTIQTQVENLARFPAQQSEIKIVPEKRTQLSEISVQAGNRGPASSGRNRNLQNQSDV